MNGLQAPFKHFNIWVQAGLLLCLTAFLGLGTGWQAPVARAEAFTSHATSCPAVPGEAPSPTRQFRAVWIATVVNIDWPDHTGLPVETQKQQFIKILDKMQQMHMNAIVVQVRPSADALYPSTLYPWSQYLTGVQGQDPGYDPLAFMIQQAHQRNIEFHAWFNPYRVSLGNSLDALAPDNPARLHPDWVVSYGNQLAFNPGLPAVRDYITAGIMEVVHKYDIDGVHFDDYFYPYPVAGQSFPDQATYQQYGGAFSNIADWRRDNVNKLVHGVSTAIKEAKPYVKFGISPFGVWRNSSTDSTGSATHAGVQDYDDLYADTRTWIKNNWLDYIVPQIYWNIGFAPAAYDVLVPWWSHEVDQSNVQLFIGQAVYKIGSSGAWLDPDQMPQQLALNLKYPEVKGSIFFSMKELFTNPLGFTDKLSNNIYKDPALIPIMPALGGGAPQKVVLEPAQQATQGVALNWFDNQDQAATYYAVYRCDHSSNACDSANALHLLGTVRHVDSATSAGKHSNGDGVLQTFVDTTAQANQTYTYYITALDRLHHESQPSDGQMITLK
ncbi:MAG TPA: family 10 glycosylhydrolase [Ktedonobacteraceae bacterium]|nr:family 10 glycosylhydrolase [Ktedonobacteraceae bacterium]